MNTSPSPAPTPRARTRPILWSLIRNQFLLIIAFTVAILWLLGWTGQRTVRRLSTEVVERAAISVETSVVGVVEPINDQLHMMGSWIEQSARAEVDTKSVSVAFTSILSRVPHVQSVFFASDCGLHLEVQRHSNAEKPSVLWQFDRGDSSSGFVHRTFLDQRLDVVDQERREFNEDPRDKPWFHAAVEAPGQVTIAEPNQLFDGREEGVLMSLAVTARRSQERWVIGLDLGVGELRRFIGSLSPTAGAAVSVLPQSLPEGSEQQRPLPKQVTAVLPEVRARGAEASLFTCEALGETWWVATRTLNVIPERPFLAVVVVPEADLLGEIRQSRIAVLMVCVLLLGVALLVAVQMARGYSRALKSLADSSSRIQRLELDQPSDVVSPVTEIATLATAQDQMRSALRSFSRYVPLDLVRRLLARGVPATVGGESQQLTILFTDIAGFTSIAERLGPQQLAEHMGEYFESLCTVIHATNGTIDKFIGDAILAFWGAPEPLDRPTTAAVDGMLGCCRALAEKNEEWQQRQLPPLPTRFGLATGSVVVGNIGFQDRLSYTVLGDAANLASRLESLNSRYGTEVLVSSAVLDALADEGTHDRYTFRCVDRVAVKGKSHGVEIYEILGAADEVTTDERDHAAVYEQALRAHWSREFAEALRALGELPPGVMAASVELLRQRCEEYLKAAPPDDWDGTEVLRSKV